MEVEAEGCFWTVVGEDGSSAAPARSQWLILACKREEEEVAVYELVAEVAFSFKMQLELA